jgi:hypothetical protein
MLSTFWWLVVGHFVADYPLQTDFVAKFKARAASLAAVPWYYVLSGHAATHAAAVGLVTGSPPLAALEFAAHWLIDWAKCEGKTGIHADQLLHVACKALWAGLALAAK